MSAPLPDPSAQSGDHAESDPLGAPGDVLARLRLRARLTAGEARRWRETPGRRGARGRPRLRLGVNRWAVVGVALILVVVVGSFVAPAIGARDGGDTPVGAGVEDAGPEGVTWETPAASEPPEEAEGSAVVHVAGAVAAPGVYTLPAGARVIDAVDQAGGASPEADLGALNLAAPVRDGERIYVPLPGETPPAVLGSDVSGPSAGGSSGETGASGLVPVNTATAEELTALPGIGPVLAQRIVDFREAHGPFDALGDLGEVSGIGPKILASLADAVSF